MFSGDVGAPAQSFGTKNADGSAAQPYTALATTPVSREMPYLYLDAHHAYRVFVPSTQTSSKGTSWGGGQTPGRSLPLSSFFVATPGDSTTKINSALAHGKNLLLTSGIYHTNRSIAVKRADTVVLGLGLATIEPDAGNTGMTTADVPGIDIAGIIFDAGAKTSPALLQVGSAHTGRGNPRASSSADPTGLQDVFFRVGGAHLGRAGGAEPDLWEWGWVAGSGLLAPLATAVDGMSMR